jgi:hypothetical protein
MTDITERKIEFRELNRMVIVCKHCSAELTIDISNEEQFNTIKAKRSSLTCPICDTAFDSRMAEAIGAFAICHDRLFKSGHSVFFRVAQ